MPELRNYIDKVAKTNPHNAKQCNCKKILINPIPTGVSKLRVGVWRLGSKIPVGSVLCTVTQFGIIRIGIIGLGAVLQIWHLES